MPHSLMPHSLMPHRPTTAGLVRRGLVLATVVACAVVPLSACGPGSDLEGSTVERSEQIATLAQRPDIEAAQADYLAMLATIREELVAEFGIAAWEPAENGTSGSACGADFPDVGADGEIRRLTSGMSPGNLPDDRWEAAVAKVAATAAAHGFTAPTPVVDRPGDHEVSLRDQYGAELLFGTARNTTLSVSTGCHLTPQAHSAG